jgi:hypothetical protein
MARIFEGSQWRGLRRKSMANIFEGSQWRGFAGSQWRGHSREVNGEASLIVNAEVFAGSR